MSSTRMPSWHSVKRRQTLDTTIDQANGAFTTILIPKSLIVEEAKGL